MMNHTQETNGHVARFGAPRAIKTVPKPLVAALALLAALVTTLPLSTPAQAETTFPNEVCDDEAWQTVDKTKMTEWLDAVSHFEHLNDPICPPFGETLLHMAARHASPEILKMIVDKGAGLDVQTPADSCVPLCRALFWGNFEGAKFLAKAGGPEITTPRGSPLERALLYAEPSNLTEYLDHLAGEGFTFTSDHLVLALRNLNADMANNLLMAGVDPNMLTTVRVNGVTRNISAFEYSVAFASDSNALVHLANAGAKLNYTGQQHEEGLFALDKLFQSREDSFDRAMKAMEEFFGQFEFDRPYLICADILIDRDCISYSLTADIIEARALEHSSLQHMTSMIPKPIELGDHGLAILLKAAAMIDKYGYRYDI